MIYIVVALLALAAYVATVHRANSLRYPHIDEVLAEMSAEEKNRELKADRGMPSTERRSTTEAAS